MYWIYGMVVVELMDDSVFMDFSFFGLVVLQQIVVCEFVGSGDVVIVVVEYLSVLGQMWFYVFEFMSIGMLVGF